MMFFHIQAGKSMSVVLNGVAVINLEIRMINNSCSQNRTKFALSVQVTIVIIGHPIRYFNCVWWRQTNIAGSYFCSTAVEKGRDEKFTYKYLFSPQTGVLHSPGSEMETMGLWKEA